MTRRIGGTVLACLLAACVARAPRPLPPLPDGRSVPELAAAIAAAAADSEHEGDSTKRAELAAAADRDAAACLAQAARAAACLYGRAVASGLEVKAHPTRAGDLLKSMLENLAAAEAADAGYDHAGPARVQALVLIRAPGWPLGPGDPESGLAAARRAATLEPDYPPNWLALAEASAKSGDPAGAQTSYARARAAAQALSAGAERDAWLRAADDALRRAD